MTAMSRLPTLLALLLLLGGCASFNEMLPDEDSSAYQPPTLDYSLPPTTGGGLYRTTELFLERMGLESLDELPSLAPLLPEIDGLDYDET